MHCILCVFVSKGVCVCEHKSVFLTKTEWRVCAWLGKETGREARKGFSLCLLLFSSTLSAYNTAVQWKEHIGRKRETQGGRKERYEREKRGLKEGRRRYCLNKELEERYWSQFSKQRHLFGSHSQQGDWENWSISCTKKNILPEAYFITQIRAILPLSLLKTQPNQPKMLVPVGLSWSYFSSSTSSERA